MHYPLFRALVAAFAVGLISLAAAPATTGAPAGKGHYIIVLKEGAGDPANAARDHAKAYGANASRFYTHALNGYAASVPADRIGALRRDSRVLMVSEDTELRIAGDDDCDTTPASVQCIPNGIERIEGRSSSTKSGDGRGLVEADVAVLDSGIQLDHPDLNVVGGVNCAHDKVNTFGDVNGHGTHVGGTIAAFDDAIGVVGVAPGARLWSVRVVNSKGVGPNSALICGIDWVTSTRLDADPSNDIDVANLSLGGPGKDDGNCGLSQRDAVHLAICRSVAAGVTYVVAAGNSAVDASRTIPAAYSEVITVSALADFDGKPGGTGITSEFCPAVNMADDTLASFSNHGAVVDLIAPGWCIWSTWSGGGNQDQILSGTSMATPHVAGAAALYISRHRATTPAQVRAALIATGTYDWNNSGDPDGIKEPLVNVDGF